jgi:hypothetical protein
MHRILLLALDPGARRSSLQDMLQSTLAIVARNARLVLVNLNRLERNENSITRFSTSLSFGGKIGL